jgi:GNAT superfamily N-acetyltransferase
LAPRAQNSEETGELNRAHARLNICMVDLVTFNPEQHWAAWEQFVADSYHNPNYVLLSPAYTRWQFLDNPANETRAYTLWLVLHDGAVVAQLGFVPFCGRSPAGERFRGAYPINLIVRPDYRAAGLGVILLSRLLKQTQWVINPGVNEAGAVLGLGLGMRDLGFLHRYIAVLNAAGAKHLSADGRLPLGITEASPQSPAQRATAATRLPAHTPDVYSLPLAAYGAERSRDLLRWRYESHPAFTYEFLLSEDRKNILVFHEERETQSGALVIRIVDLLAVGEAQGTLLGAALSIARARNAVLADFFCSLTCYDAALKGEGFFNEADHEDGRIAALFQPLDFRKVGIRVLASGPPGHSTGNWYITKADSDQDRPNDKRSIRDA